MQCCSKVRTLIGVFSVCCRKLSMSYYFCISSDSGPSSHRGQWRDKRETRYHCATKSEERHNGGPLCQHEGGIIQDSHWSCCGSLSMNSKCSMAKSSFPCNLTLPSPAPLPSAAVVPKLMAKISQFNSEFAERKRLQLTPQELNGVQVC